MTSLSARVSRHKPALDLPTGATAAALVLAAAAIGIVPVLLPEAATLALLAAVLLVVVVSAIWILLRRDAAVVPFVAVESLARPRSDDQATSITADFLIRTGRLFFFLGAATVTEGNWRPVGVTVSEVAFFAALGCSCLAVLFGKPAKRLPSMLAAGVGLFAIGALLSSWSAGSPTNAISELSRPMWTMLFLPWTASMVLRDRRDIVTAVLLWSVSAAINGIAAVAHTGALAGSDRVAGLMPTPNDLGGAMAAALIPALTLASRVRPRLPLLGLVQWLIVGFVLAGLGFSGSVGSIVGALLGVMVWLTSPSIPSQARVAIVLSLVAVLAASSTIGGAVPSPTKRIVQVLGKPGADPNAGSASQRVSMISAAWIRIRSDPVVGTGLSNFNEIVHNEAVAAWYTGGIFGIAGLLLVIGTVLSVGWRGTLASPTARDRIIGWSLLCSFVAFTVFAMTEPLYFQEYGWFGAALLVAWCLADPPTNRAVSTGGHDEDA